MNPQDERILGGNLETLGLQATLKMLALGGKTGQLSVSAADNGNGSRERLDIYLQRGNIIALQSSDPIQIDLLDILRLMRRVPRNVALDIRQQAGTQLPDVLYTLTERGIVSPTEYQQRIEFGIIQEIARALRWEHGTFEFHANLRVQENTAMQPLSVDHILLEAIRMVDEWAKVTTLSRYSIPRWLPDPKVDPMDLKLDRDEMNVLFLANGQIPIYAIAYGLLTPEARVAQYVEQLLQHQLIEVVDDQLERALEQHLANVFAVSQEALRHDHGLPSEKRMQILLGAMGTCINKLLSHHGMYARVLRGQQIANNDRLAYLDEFFLPLLSMVQRQYPIIETTRFLKGQLDYSELVDLHKLVRGDQLETFYWEAAQAFHKMMVELYHAIVADEIGGAALNRRFNAQWEAFEQEIDGEMKRHHARRMAARR
ncbi:MAG TPA: DUF4388 domain-containing protein [Ktedonobacterales bacterium]|nr:DUF4388 domain-containing protein [Ktedonobacterales bacterium]